MGEAVISEMDISSTKAEAAEDEAEFKPPLPMKAAEKGEDNGSVLMSIVEPTLDYKPPPFAVSPPVDDKFGFEVIKNGTLMGRIDFEQRKAATFLVIGRLPSCDIHMEHPTISRHHCVLQYGEDLMNRTGKGWHIYDLGSTHGTKLNKQRIPPRQFIRIRVGHVVQFGVSSRIMTLFGPDWDVEPEWECSPTEMKRLIEQKKLYDKIQKEKEKTVSTSSESEKEGDGVMWGLDYDEEMAYAHAHEGEDFQDRAEKYRDDPLKVLSRFFESEGFDMEFSYEETGTGHNHKWICSIELPVDTAVGQSLAASATCSGSKKEAQTLCAFNACRTLDMHGVLFRSSNEARKKAKNLAENDYYDSDEDTFFDRTGQIEKNREKRRLRALESKGKDITEAETFESLTEKIASTSEEMSKVANQLTAISTKTETKNDENEDDLDSYCRELENSTGSKDSLAVKTEKSILRQRLVFLKHEKERFERLAKIAKPVELPTLKVPSNQAGRAHTTGMLSAATVKKLMKMRRRKISDTEETVREKPAGMELPPDTFIKESDTKPFIAEVEEEENLPTTSGEALNDVEPENSAAADGELNVSTTSYVEPVSQEQGVGEFSEEHGMTTTGWSSSADEVPAAAQQHMESGLEDEIQAHSSTESDKPAKRKRTRVRDDNSPKREKTGDYGEGVANKDEDYVMWMPPTNQKGDGTIPLNEKFAGRY